MQLYLFKISELKMRKLKKKLKVLIWLEEIGVLYQNNWEDLFLISFFLEKKKNK
jgi:hypothetical protein